MITNRPTHPLGVLYVSRCVYKHETIWRCIAKPEIDDMRWCEKCQKDRRVHEVERMKSD